jgi:hypothetical protein
VTTTEQLLEQALGHVAAATQAMLELAENDVTGQLIFTTRQCLDVQTLLGGWWQTRCFGAGKNGGVIRPQNRV